jgi:hypothetical protein
MGVAMQSAADAIGISKAHLWELETGRQKPGSETWVGLTFMLEVPPLWSERQEQNSRRTKK